MELLTERKLRDFGEKVMRNRLYELEGTPRVEFVAPEEQDAVILIGDKKFAVTLNSLGTLLVAGYGPVEQAEYVRHGVWELTKDGKTYRQDILAEWVVKKAREKENRN